MRFGLWALCPCVGTAGLRILLPLDSALPFATTDPDMITTIGLIITLNVTGTPTVTPTVSTPSPLSRVGAFATVPARCKLYILGVSGGPPGDNCNHQEALKERTNTTQKPPGFTGDHRTTPRKTGLVLAAQLFWGCMGFLGGCILGWFTGA